MVKSIFKSLAFLALALGTYAAPQDFARKEIPKSGDNGAAGGGIFGLVPGAKRPSQTAKGKGGMMGGSQSPKPSIMNDNLPGSGPYPAKYFSDPSLPDHVIYAPTVPPKDIKLPVFIWGNGGCAAVGTLYQNFLREIASHGFIAIANGPATTGFSKGQTKQKAMTDSLEWATKGGAGGKYGIIDSANVAVGGQSCGGLEALAAIYHEPRIKTALIFNSGVIDNNKKYLLQEMKSPMAYFIGGPKDLAFENAETDFALMPKRVPLIKANLDTGHMGAFMDKYGGKSAKIGVAYLKWLLKGDEEAKRKFFDPSSTLIKDGWNITSKNWT